MITLADGTVIDPVSKRVVDNNDGRQDDDTSSSAIVLPIARAGVKIEDYNTDPKTLNVIMAVVAYTMSGLSDNDICYALNCTSSQLLDIRDNEGYRIAYDNLVEAFYEGQKHTAKEIIGKASVMAAEKLVSIAKARSKQSLSAINSILDRNDIGKANSGSALSGLVIRMVNDDKKQTIEVNING